MPCQETNSDYINEFKIQSYSILYNVIQLAFLEKFLQMPQNDRVGNVMHTEIF